MSSALSIESVSRTSSHTTRPHRSGDPPSFPSGRSSRPTFDDIDDENKFCEAENFLRENENSTKVLVAMCIGLMDNGGKNPLIDITQHPWMVLGKKKNNFKPLNPDLIAEIDRHWDINFSQVDGGDLSRKPRPSQWKNPKLMKWLTSYPINDDMDIAFRTKEAKTRTKLACHATASKMKNNADLEGNRAWQGCKPMLCAIVALVQNDDVKMLYLKRQDVF